MGSNHYAMNFLNVFICLKFNANGSLKSVILVFLYTMYTIHSFWICLTIVMLTIYFAILCFNANVQDEKVKVIGKKMRKSLCDRKESDLNVKSTNASMKDCVDPVSRVFAGNVKSNRETIQNMRLVTKWGPNGTTTYEEKTTTVSINTTVDAITNITTTVTVTTTTVRTTTTTTTTNTALPRTSVEFVKRATEPPVTNGKPTFERSGPANTIQSEYHTKSKSILTTKSSNRARRPAVKTKRSKKTIYFWTNTQPMKKAKKVVKATTGEGAVEKCPKTITDFYTNSTRIVTSMKITQRHPTVTPFPTKSQPQTRTSIETANISIKRAPPTVSPKYETNERVWQNLKIKKFNVDVYPRCNNELTMFHNVSTEKSTVKETRTNWNTGLQSDNKPLLRELITHLEGNKGHKNSVSKARVVSTDSISVSKNATVNGDANSFGHFQEKEEVSTRGRESFRSKLIGSRILLNVAVAAAVAGVTSVFVAYMVVIHSLREYQNKKLAYILQVIEQKHCADKRTLHEDSGERFRKNRRIYEADISTQQGTKRKCYFRTELRSKQFHTAMSQL